MLQGTSLEEELFLSRIGIPEILPLPTGSPPEPPRPIVQSVQRIHSRQLGLMATGCLLGVSLGLGGCQAGLVALPAAKRSCKGKCGVVNAAKRGGARQQDLNEV